MASYDEDLVIGRRRGERVHVYGRRRRRTPNLRLPRSSRRLQTQIRPLTKHWHGIDWCSPCYYGDSWRLSRGGRPNETRKAGKGRNRERGRQYRAPSREAPRWLSNESRLTTRGEGTAGQDSENTIPRRPFGGIWGVSRKQPGPGAFWVC